MRSAGRRSGIWRPGSGGASGSSALVGESAIDGSGAASSAEFSNGHEGLAQTFKHATLDLKITHVDVWIAKQGSPGTGTIGIRNTTGSPERPDNGAYLCSKSLDLATFPTWIGVGDTTVTRIHIPNCPWLDANTMYALTIEGLGAHDASNRIAWDFHTSTIAGTLHSETSGTWSTGSVNDMSVIIYALTRTP